MELKNVKALDNGGSVVVNLKRKRATKQRALSFTSSFDGVDEPSDRQNKRARSCLCKNGCCCCFGKSVVKNYSNFMKSGLPKRVLYYENESWKNVSNELIDLLREDFKTRKVISEVVCQGHRSLFDFLHMVHINLETGLPQQIAWIDESGCCFFPEIWSNLCELHGCSCSGGGNISHCTNLEPKGTQEIKLELTIAISGINSSSLEGCGDKLVSRVKEDAEASVSHVRQLDNKGKPYTNCNDLDLDCVDSSKPGGKINERIAENGCSAVPAFNYPSAVSMHSKLIRLASDESENDVVRSKFLVGLTPLIDESNIVEIYRVPRGDIFEKRLQLFQKQIEFTEKYRGNANVHYAWFGSSKETATRVMIHGFGHSEVPKSKPMYGFGIHLSPENCSNISASCSDVDENGVQHMVLCRAIMGNMELVDPGSKQFQPSSENFDSGIDDLQNPKQYVIWTMNMNAHIYPEYVVSFTMPSREKENLVVNKSQCNLSGVTSLPYHGKPQQDPDPADPELIIQPPSASVKPVQEDTRLRGLTAPKIPSSPWMPFSMLFAAVSNKLTPKDKDLIDRHYDDFKKKKINRAEFIQKLRCTVGDELLRSTIKSLQAKAPLIDRCESTNQQFKKF